MRCDILSALACPHLGCAGPPPTKGCYQLVAFSTHQGRANSGGHFTSVVWSEYDQLDSWIGLDDVHVGPLENMKKCYQMKPEMVNDAKGKPLFITTRAYMVLYKRIGEQEE